MCHETTRAKMLLAQLQKELPRAQQRVKEGETALAGIQAAMTKLLSAPAPAPAPANLPGPSLASNLNEILELSKEQSAVNAATELARREVLTKESQIQILRRVLGLA